MTGSGVGEGVRELDGSSFADVAYFFELYSFFFLLIFYPRFLLKDGLVVLPFSTFRVVPWCPPKRGRRRRFRGGRFVLRPFRVPKLKRCMPFVTVHRISETSSDHRSDLFRSPWSSHVLSFSAVALKNAACPTPRRDSFDRSSLFVAPG